MRKLKASFVVLAPEKRDTAEIVGHLANLGLRSVAILYDAGSVADGWDNWNDSNFDRIVLCSESADSMGANT